MLKKTITLFLGLGLLAGCEGPSTSSGSGDFFNLGLPTTHNKLSVEDEKKAHDVVTMLQDTLKDVGEGELSGDFSLAGQFQRGTYQPKNIAEQLYGVCSYEVRSESSDRRGKTVVTRFSNDVQKSTDGLNSKIGEELIHCPVALSGAFTTTEGIMTKAAESIEVAKGELVVSIGHLKEVDKDKSTNEKMAYKTKELTPVRNISVHSDSHKVYKRLRDYRTPGKLVQSITNTYEISYMDGGVLREATVTVMNRKSVRSKQFSDQKSLNYGRTVNGLLIEMENGAASVESTTEHNGDLGQKSYTRVNGKLKEDKFNDAE